jgi:hypothetical protein
MKRVVFFILLVIFVTFTPLFAQESDAREYPVTFLLNFTNFGVGINLPFKEHSVEVTAELLKFGIEHKVTHFGVELSPFKFFGWAGSGSGNNNNTPNDDPYNEPKSNTGFNTEGVFSFFNLSVFWNPLGSLNTGFYFAPFASFHYLFLGNEFYLDRYVLTAGLQSGIRGGERVKYNMFSIETGFRLINTAPHFYAGIKFDFLMHMLNQRGMFN